MEYTEFKPSIYLKRKVRELEEEHYELTHGLRSPSARALSVMMDLRQQRHEGLTADPSDHTNPRDYDLALVQERLDTTCERLAELPDESVNVHVRMDGKAVARSVARHNKMSSFVVSPNGSRAVADV